MKILNTDIGEFKLYFDGEKLEELEYNLNNQKLKIRKYSIYEKDNFEIINTKNDKLVGCNYYNKKEISNILNLENMKNSIETSNEAIKNAIQGVVDDTSQKLVQQIEALDKQMSEELSRALELMGSKLTSLSNQFVKDYEPLTKQLSSLVQNLNQRSQSSESDN